MLASVARRECAARPVARSKLKNQLNIDGKGIAIRTEIQTMHPLLSPLLASGIWIGGGSVGLVVLILVVVLLVRR